MGCVMLLINVPIESIPNRYSIQWNNWFPHYLNEMAIPHLDTGYSRVGVVGAGNFLDPITTLETKSFQTSQLIGLAKDGKLGKDTVIFLHDGWHTCLPTLAYLRHMGGLQFKIAAMLHAGTYDPYDAISRANKQGWASGFESAFFKQIDLLILATDFHVSLIHKARLLRAATTDHVVCPFPVRQCSKMLLEIPKKKLIVFPHRLALEKQSDTALQIIARVCSDHPDWSWIATKQHPNMTQDEYYATLEESMISVSMALQETYGIAMIESTLCGAIPLVPNRLAYKDIFPVTMRYSTNNEEQALEKALRHLIMMIDKLGYAKTVKMWKVDSLIDQLGSDTMPENAVPAILNEVVNLVAQKSP